MAIQKQKLAADILEYVGGVDNVCDVAHCMTRLRIVVKDEKAVQMKQLEKLEGVMKVVILGESANSSMQLRLLICVRRIFKAFIYYIQTVAVITAFMSTVECSEEEK